MPADYEQVVFSITGLVRKQGFNKYEFKYIRDKLYEEAEKLIADRISKDALAKKLEQSAVKYINKGLKKKVLEFTFNILFVITAIVAVCLPFIYGLNFNKDPELYPIFSTGLDINIALSNVSNLLLYFGIGLSVALLIQKMEKAKKITLFAILVGVFILLITFFQELARQYPEVILKVNFILVELIALSLAVVSYFVEDYVARKSFNKKYKIK
jgi:uncharacterized membrane protein